ncbi:SDR family oxidoreductase [Cohnella nanjingensis]|uniref:SDR family oxidoreductase n=1 Tax=Cohnella nanjingensis TaxID=1387779 RepID=A0A7X0RLU5_9BACL|nr:SDR family oxidoreductase [Cohnella nanjingensis]MBB6669897.1 SDR family oxidoreductase [Cohnella nanjingensis]
MDLGLKGKTALVLASSKGLGKATALQLALEGANVAVLGREERTIRKTADEIAQASGTAPIALVADITQAGDIDRAVQATVERFGGLDILINNSGGPKPGKFDQLSDEHWQSAFELTLLSYIRAIRAALPHMRERGFGRIVNFTSSSIKEPIDNLMLSSTFRVGVVGLAKSLAADLAKEGILINTVGPGRFATDRILELDEANAERSGQPLEQVQAAAAALIPAGRYGTPEEFGKLVAFLASPANSYMTGQSLLIDGGAVRAI